MKKIATIGVAIVLAAAVLLGQGRTSPEVQLKAAIHKEQVEGDLNGAVELFKTLAQSANRAVAAQAWLHLGQCYEKLGAAQAADARKAYERVVSAYADQSEAAGSARTRLAALATPATATSGSARFRLALGAASGAEQTYAISQDGRYFAHTVQSGRVIAVEDLVVGRTRELDGLGEPGAPVTVRSLEFSPDGRQLAYSAISSPPYSAQVRIASTTGGTPRVMAERATLGWWSPDGRDIHVFPMTDSFALAVSIVSVASGTIRPGHSTPLDTLTVTSELRRSPDGRYIAYTRYENYTGKDFLAGRPTPSTTVVAAMDLATGDEVRLTPGDNADRDPFWTPDGEAVAFLRDKGPETSLWAVRFRNGKADGAPVLAHTFAAANRRPPLASPITPVGITADGAYQYLERVDTGRRYVVEVDADHRLATEVPVKELPSDCGYAWGWSSDGRSLAVTRPSSPAIAPVYCGGDRLVIRSLDDGTERIITPNMQGMRRPRWSPDGKSILVVGQQGQTYGIFALDVASGAVKLLLPHPAWTSNNELLIPAADWSPDGKGILIGRRAAAGMELVFHDLATGLDSVRYTTAMIFWPGQTSIGPDGSAYLLGNLRDTDNSLVRAVTAVPPSGEKPRVVFQAKPPNTAPSASVSPDGKGVWVSRRMPTAQEPDLHEVLWVPTDGGQPVASGLAGLGLQGVFPSPDGSKLFVVRNGNAQQLWTLENALPKVGASGKR